MRTDKYGEVICRGFANFVASAPKNVSLSCQNYQLICSSFISQDEFS